MEAKQIIVKIWYFIIIIFLFYPKLGLSQPKANLYYPEVPRISTSEAFELFKKDVAIIADVSAKKRYKGKHIFGAINIPAEGSERIVDKVKIRVPEGKKLLLYCRWPDEYLSAQAGHILMQKGTKNIAVILGGEEAMIGYGFSWYEGGEVIIQEEKKIKLKLE